MSKFRNDETDGLVQAKTAVAAIGAQPYYPVGGRDACMRERASNLEIQHMTGELQALAPTTSHGDERARQVGLVGIWAGSPLENEGYRLVYQEVQNGEVDIELVFVLVFHTPSKVEEAVKWFAVGVVPGCDCGRQLLLQVAHGWVVNMVSGQHGERSVVCAVG